MPQFSLDPPLASLRDHEECRAAIRSGSRSFYGASRLLPPRSGGRPSASTPSAGSRTTRSISKAGRQRRSSVCAIASSGPARDGPSPSPPTGRWPISCAAPPFRLLSRWRFSKGSRGTPKAERYERLDDLFDYAVRVAGTVGVMMTLLMGVRSRRALARACDLGVAMQLTNIARDVGEDARLGRLYLPRQWLREAGVDAAAWIANPTPCDGIRSVVARLLEAAETLYSRAHAGVRAAAG